MIIMMHSASLFSVQLPCVPCSLPWEMFPSFPGWQPEQGIGVTGGCGVNIAVLTGQGKKHRILQSISTQHWFVKLLHGTGFFYFFIYD